MWIRLAQNGCVFANLPCTLVHTRVGSDMYKRRGGSSYYKSEIELQKYMHKMGIIGYGTYVNNCFKRFVVEILLPDCIRAWLYRSFARE